MPLPRRSNTLTQRSVVSDTKEKTMNADQLNFDDWCAANGIGADKKEEYRVVWMAACRYCGRIAEESDKEMGDTKPLLAQPSTA
jgi:hypothetical protein